MRRQVVVDLLKTDLQRLRAHPGPLNEAKLGACDVLVDVLARGSRALALKELLALVREMASSEDMQQQVAAESLLCDSNRNSLQRRELVGQQVGYDERHVRRLSDAGFVTLANFITDVIYRKTQLSPSEHTVVLDVVHVNEEPKLFLIVSSSVAEGDEDDRVTHLKLGLENERIPIEDVGRPRHKNPDTYGRQAFTWTILVDHPVLPREAQGGDVLWTLRLYYGIERWAAPAHFIVRRLLPGWSVQTGHWRDQLILDLACARQPESLSFETWSHFHTVQLEQSASNEKS